MNLNDPASDAADLLPLLEDADEASPAPSLLARWRVLIVDDDEDVHVATELALRDVLIEGRAVEFLHAKSAAQALQRVRDDTEIAAILLDVVMETPDAGLRLVRQIRQELARSAVRIILRTGQPGYAPEIETLRNFDINDYLAKAELTRVRLFSSLTTAIRAYAQLHDVMRQRDELARLNVALEAARAAERTEAAARLEAEAALRTSHETLDDCVAQRTHELSRAIAELDAFNRRVSHDLSGPLHGLASLSGLIQGELDAGDPAKVRLWLGLMETQTRGLAELVGELLVLSQVSKGTLQREPAALGQVVHEALQTLALNTPAELVAAVTVGPLPVWPADARLLRQVFINLLSNAIKFSAGSARPQVEVQAEQRGDECLVTVSDNGIGFDVQRADELFKPFSRLHGARYEGSGIGLTIVQRIVERHGGRVWAQGRFGGGAVFQFTLPKAG